MDFCSLENSRHVFGRQGGSAGRGSALAGSDIGGPKVLVFLRRQLLQIRGSTFDGLLKELLKERDAPSATGAGAAARRQLAGNARLFDAEEIE
jgi:hypothetical protein